jgi:hypothetical protein
MAASPSNFLIIVTSLLLEAGPTPLPEPAAQSVADRKIHSE